MSSPDDPAPGAETRVVAYDGAVGHLVDVLSGRTPTERYLEVAPPFGARLFVPVSAVARTGERFVLLKGTRREIERLALRARPQAFATEPRRPAGLAPEGIA
jgi:hypothetical protein